MNAETKIARAPDIDARPVSAVSAMVGIVGLVPLLAWTAAARWFEMEGPLAALTALPICALPMVVWSLAVDKVHRNPSNGIDWDGPPRPRADTRDISIVKIAALWTTWAAIGAFYCIARWYWDGGYLFAMGVLGAAAVPLLLLSVPYIFWIDRRLKEPRDGAWHFGQIIAGRADRADREIVHDYLRSWAIKAFFLAFMISILPGNWIDVIRPQAADIASNPVRLAQWLIAAMFMIDVTFATLGYVLTMKPLDAHIRSANPYAAGWMAALICYPPFILMNPGGPLDYHQGTGDWIYWMEGAPLATALTGAVLVSLTAVYAWATMCFGFRFSNLTHRGILTHGPYAWTKHPAYVSKNLFWWIATLPFLATTDSFTDMVRNTATLTFVTAVYCWRAKTEERHLSADPAYRDYAAWMKRNAPIPRLVAALKGGPRRQQMPAE